MLEWLKGILGDKYSDEIDTKISAEIGKNFVSRSDFNQANAAKKKAEDDLKERDNQLETLKSASGDTDALKKQIEDLQKQNAAAKTEYEKQLAQMQLENAVDKALTSAGAKNNTAARALLAGFIADAKLSPDGTVKGLAAEIESLAKNADTAFLFKEKNSTPPITGMAPGTAGGSTPPAAKEPKDMTYEELSAYLAQNPNAKL